MNFSSFFSGVSALYFLFSAFSCLLASLLSAPFCSLASLLSLLSSLQTKQGPTLIHVTWASRFPGLTPKAIPPSLTSIIDPTYSPHPFKTRLNCIGSKISSMCILSIICIICIISIICTPQAQDDPLGPAGSPLKIPQSSFDLPIILQSPWVAQPISSTQARIRLLGQSLDLYSLSGCTAECWVNA